MATDKEHGKWYTAWCEFFQSLLTERKLNPSDFAELVGNRQNNIWRYLNGDVRPPVKSLAMWSQRLHLDDSEKEKLIRLGKLAYAPPEVREELTLMRQQYSIAREEIDALKRFLEQQGMDLSSLK